MVGVGEMIASAVVKQIAGKLGDVAAGEVALQWGFKDDALKLAGKMEDLEAVMHDADNKLRQGGSSGEAVERWLTKLSSVAYDAEDVLDELAATELIKKIQPKVIYRCTALLRSWSPLQRLEDRDLFMEVSTRLESSAKEFISQHGWLHNLRIEANVL